MGPIGPAWVPDGPNIYMNYRGIKIYVREGQ
jgi:hypothetical protein